MSIDMFLPEVQQQTASVVKMCRSYIAGMEEVKKSIIAFSKEQELKGKTYDSAKRYFTKTYIPLADGIILLSETMIKAHQQFPDRYIAEVDSNSLQSASLENQIQRLEYSIQSMERTQAALPVLNVAIRGAILSLRFMQSKVKDKLQRLVAFDGSSVQIFSDIERILKNVEAGLAEVSSGKAWNPASGSFDTSRLNNMKWAEDIKTRVGIAVLEGISMRPNLQAEDLEIILKFATENPDSEIPQNILTFLNKNKENILFALTGSTFSESFKTTGRSFVDFGEHVKEVLGEKGKLSFKHLTKYANKVGNFFVRHGKSLTRVGYGVNAGFGSAGLGIGMYGDLVNKDKTVGEAIAHNITVLGTGAGASALTAFLLGSNPGGWAILGTVAVGTGVAYGVDFLYQKNWLGFQDALDTTGEAVEKSFKDLIIIGGPIIWKW